jgi:hypothetical protein
LKKRLGAIVTANRLLTRRRQKNYKRKDRNIERETGLFKRKKNKKKNITYFPIFGGKSEIYT